MRTRIMEECDKKTVDTAVSILEKGGLVIYPTETQYGIGADVTNKKALKKVFEVKQRHDEKKFIWAFSDIQMIKKYFSLNGKQEKLVRKLMPGPFSLVMDGEGFRIPDNEVAMKIIKQFGKPITTTSANISGKKNSSRINDVIKLFDGKADIIIDAGDLKKSKASTVFRWDDKKILRRGPVSRKEIIEALQ